MPLRSLVTQLQQAALTGELLERTGRRDRLLMRGAGRGSRALVASAMARRQDCPLLVVVPTLEEAGRWTSLLELMGWSSTSLYPTSEGPPRTVRSHQRNHLGAAAGSQRSLGDQSVTGPGAIVATERCLQPHLPPPDALRDICRTLRKGDEIDLEDLGETLAQLGYERVSSIDQEGTWSRRGDIVDIFPVSSELPVRLEFFGEELDKLREFDPATQRSLDPVEQLRLTPTGFGPLIADALRESMPDGLEQLLGEQAAEQLLEGGTPEGMRRLMGLAWSQPASLLDYLPKSTAVVIDERRHGLAHGQQWLDHASDHHREVAAECGLSEEERDQLWPPLLHRPIAEAYNAAESFSGLTSRNCWRKTTTPTALISPADRFRPIPINSGNWRSWSRASRKSEPLSGLSQPSPVGRWPCWRSTTASVASSPTPAMPLRSSA